MKKRNKQIYGNSAAAKTVYMPPKTVYNVELGGERIV